jgi:hypothetical protein
MKMMEEEEERFESTEDPAYNWQDSIDDTDDEIDQENERFERFEEGLDVEAGTSKGSKEDAALAQGPDEVDVAALRRVRLEENSQMDWVTLRNYWNGHISRLELKLNVLDEAISNDLLDDISNFSASLLVMKLNELDQAMPNDLENDIKLPISKGLVRVAGLTTHAKRKAGFRPDVRKKGVIFRMGKGVGGTRAGKRGRRTVHMKHLALKEEDRKTVSDSFFWQTIASKPCPELY